ncbi:MAG: hypothetical protein ACI4QT_02075, partial [Kiritimatiellia bacterium]
NILGYCDAQGNVVAQYAYDAFGKTKSFRHKCGSGMPLVKMKSVANMEREARNVCNARHRAEAHRVD